MAYVKEVWIDDVTDVTAEKMNHIEGGIYDAHVTKISDKTTLITKITDIKNGGTYSSTGNCVDAPTQGASYDYFVFGNVQYYSIVAVRNITGDVYYGSISSTDGSNYTFNGWKTPLDLKTGVIKPVTTLMGSIEYSLTRIGKLCTLNLSFLTIAELTNNVTLFTLPDDFKPAGNKFVQFAISDVATTGRLKLGSDGVCAYTGSTSIPASRWPYCNITYVSV